MSMIVFYLIPLAFLFLSAFLASSSEFDFFGSKVVAFFVAILVPVYPVIFNLIGKRIPERPFTPGKTTLFEPVDGWLWAHGVLVYCPAMLVFCLIYTFHAENKLGGILGVIFTGLPVVAGIMFLLMIRDMKPMR